MSYQETPELQALRERIRASTKDAVVLEEMRRLGYWPKDEAIPDSRDAASEIGQIIQREGELVGELHKMAQDLHRLSDPQQALQEMRKQRMAAARAKREETRRRHAGERHQRAAAWHAQRQKSIAWLGEEVSTGLADVRTDVDRLHAKGLPVIESIGELARLMGVPLAELRFLGYQRSVSRINHYHRFGIAKKTGGVRIISAPMPRMKRAQYWVLDKLLASQPVSASAHGFVPGKSIVDNARAHAGHDVVINFDLKDFFPSIHYPRVKGLFSSFGYSDSVSTLLALLCTEAPTETVEMDGQRYHVQTGPRCLPQGAPTSPAITNLLCRKLDRRLEGSAKKLGFSYTRYADDMTFSAPAEARSKLGQMLWCAKQIIADEGFILHPDKQRVMHAGRRQEVTGLVVNERPAVPRETLRRFRATLFQVEKDGPEGKSWNGNGNVIAALDGYARFIYMVDADKGAPLLARIAKLKERWSSAPVRKAPGPLSGPAFRKAAGEGKAPRENWWTPAERPGPVVEKTDQQRAEDRAAAKAAIRLQKAEEASASAPASSEQAETAPPPASLAPEEAAKARALSASDSIQILIQSIVMVLAGLVTHNYLVLLGAVVWFFLSMSNKKRYNWLIWALVYIACRILGGGQ